MTLQRLLAEQGFAAELKIGVHKEHDRLSAHAWLEADGVPLGEAEDVSFRYAALSGANEGGADEL